jgi:DNA-binding LacI/PurR family transcriptional regulator
MVHGRRNPVQMPYVWAALTAAQEIGLKVLVLVDDDDGTAVRDAVGSALVDGVIVMEVQRDDPRISLLEGLKCPAVLVGSPDDPRGLACVAVDIDAAVRMCAAHLHELGHRHVGYIGQPPAVFERDLAYAVHARAAVLAALGDHDGRPPVWTACDSTPDGVLASVRDLLDQEPELTGLIVYNERAVPLVLHHLGALGYRVPQDISVVGMGYDDDGENYVPPLTSVAFSPDDIARAAVAGLDRRIAGEAVAERVIVPPTLRIRASTDVARPRS